MLLVLLQIGWLRGVAAPATNAVLLLSTAELQSRVAGASPKEIVCRIEGVVRAIVPERGIVVLQDQSESILLELPQVRLTAAVGERVVMEARPAVITRNRFGVRLENLPVTGDRRLHSAMEISGDVFLEAGMNPVRLDWFNGPSDYKLNLSYEGPGISKQKVPNSVLWHSPDREEGRSKLQPGLFYQAYNGGVWPELPDFSWLRPIASGVATNFSADFRTRDEDCGLRFDGLIQIERPGRYTFFLESDDGSCLYVGKPSVTCTVIDQTENPLPAAETFEQALADRKNGHWIKMEGEVKFVSEHDRSLYLELLVGGNRIPVTVIEGGELFSANLLHSWIQVEGICEFSRDPAERNLIGVFVPASKQVTHFNTAAEARNLSSRDFLGDAAQVRRLSSAEAGKHIPARIRGVVIFASSVAVVLQDSSGGVFISNRAGIWKEQPRVGELWEMNGTTDAGLFSPVVTADTAIFCGHAPMPEPIQPTRDQLINGNMDAEYGELHGVITLVSSNEITLLTPDGKVSVVGNRSRPLPDMPELRPNSSLAGSVVRIRGCFAPMVDLQIGQVVSGKTYIYPALVEMEDPAPQNPFLLSARKPLDLMRFNARALALQRTKLTGQIVHSIPGEFFVQNGKTGFRVLANHPALKTGDRIEAVGFPKIDGPSPVLQAAEIRGVGHATLPEPVLISPEGLLDRSLDSTRIELRAFLVSDTIHQNQRTLELQSGAQHFVARLESVSGNFTPLPAGSLLHLAGVYASAYEDPENMRTRIAPFEMLLNNPADIVVLKKPAWWTIRRILMLLVVLVGVLSATFIWVALLRRKVEQRTAQLKQEIEQRQLVEQHHAVELERTRVARDLHDELGAGLTEVGLLGSLANTPAVETEERNRYLSQITQMARSLVTSLDEIVWAVNPHYDSLPSLVSYFSLYAESFLNLAGILCRLRVDENIPSYPLDSKQRHGIFCVFKEAINNVVRHARASEVQNAFEIVEGKLALSVIDNGCGFEFVPDSPGKDGLASQRQRMRELGGGCEIKSRPRFGTTVRIFLPLSQNETWSR